MTDTTSINGQVSTARLRAARDAKGLSRERVSAQLDPPISSKTLERWERPGYPVPRWRAEQLAAIYDAPADELLEDAA